MSITSVVSDGPFIFAAGLSLAAGVVSFASPCVVPLVPGYLSYLTGLVGAEAAETKNGTGTVATAVRKKVSGRVLLATGLFVLGFSLVFLLQTVLVFGVVESIKANRDLLTTIGGVVTILMGLVMLGFVRPLQRELRWHLRPTSRVWGAPVLGLAFGLGWVACIGPVLLGITAMASSTEWNGNAWRGLILVVFYCLGLGLPFLLLAFGFSWASTGLAFLRRNSRRIQVTGAVLMIALGLVMVTGLWTDFISHLRGLYSGTETVL